MRRLHALRIPQQLRTWTDTHSQGLAVPSGMKWWQIKRRSEIHRVRADTLTTSASEHIASEHTQNAYQRFLHATTEACAHMRTEVYGSLHAHKKDTKYAKTDMQRHASIRRPAGRALLPHLGGKISGDADDAGGEQRLSAHMHRAHRPGVHPQLPAQWYTQNPALAAPAQSVNESANGYSKAVSSVDTRLGV